MDHAPDHSDIRDAVAKLCARFPGEYWRKLDREMAYPTAFVAALTEGGYLSALIPEEYGGAGLPLSAAAVILEEIQRQGCNGGRLPCPDVRMGTRAAPRHGRAEAALSAQDRRGRAAAAGLRRHRADQRHRHHVAQHHRAARWRSLRRQRPEDLDQPRRAFRPDAAAGPHHAARAGRQAHRRPVGLHRRHARGAEGRPHHPADPHDDEPRHHRGLLRQCQGAGREPDRRGGQGLSLHPLRHERRAHPDRRRMRRRRQVVHRQGARPTPRSGTCSAGRSARTRASSSRSPRPTPTCARPN